MKKSSTVRVFIGLGSNLGDPVAQVEEAIAWLGDHPEIELKQRTGPSWTEPWGLKDQPRFANAMVEVSTSLEPIALLDTLKAGEKALGRKAAEIKWGPREIDLDILLYGDQVIETARLTVPHPYLDQRPFVLEQLATLDPGLIHPKFNRLLLDLHPEHDPMAKK